MKKRIPHLLLLSLLLQINNHSTGQEKHNLSELISIGLENNFSLQIARNRQEIAENNFTRGNAGFLPVLDLSTRHSGTLNNTWQSFSDGSSENNSGLYNTTTNAGLNLGWNLFSGFRVQTTYSKLQELKSRGELQTRFAIENFIAQITSEYYNYIQHTRQLNNLQSSVDLSRERFRIDEERYLIGSGSRLQLMQSRVFLNADSSRLSRQYEILRASQIRLNEHLGAMDFDVLLGVSDSLIIVNDDLQYENLLSGTIEMNTRLLISASNQVISEYDRKIIASRTYPYLNFNTGYGYTFNTYHTGNLNSQQTLGLSYGVTLGLNIFDGYNRRREISNAMIEINIAQLTYQQLLQELKADLLSIYTDYANNLRLLEMEYENLETARESMDIGFERYRLGDLAGIELREIQQSLLEAEERLLTIQFQTKLAEISLLQISGRIMDYL